MLIYIVEDDEDIRDIERYALRSSGYEVETFSDGKGLEAALLNQIPQLIILDIMLPKEDGISLLKKLRNNNEMTKLPIMMVTAKLSEIDKVKGLDAGADDYMTKPFGIMELVARVKALLRRTEEDKLEETVIFENITMNVQKHIIQVDGINCELTYKEFELLKLFLSNIGIVLSRDKIMERVWGFDYEGETRTVDMHIKTLRKKLGDAGKYIKTVRNVGYKIDN